MSEKLSLGKKGLSEATVMGTCFGWGSSPKQSLRQEEESRQAVYLEGDPEKGTEEKTMKKKKSQSQDP